MATVVLAGFVRTGAGVALNNVAVDAYVRNTSAVSQGSTTTNASGYWTLSITAQDRYDIKVVNGTSTTWLSYDDQIQIQRVETGELFIINPANTFKYNILPAAITADRTLTLPLITATDTLATLGLAQTFTGIITFSANSGVVISGATGNTLVVDTNTLVVDATNNRVGVNVTAPLGPFQVNMGSNLNVVMEAISSNTSISAQDNVGALVNLRIDALALILVTRTAANVKIAGTATRATTEGTNHLDIFDGTAPVGTLTNGVSIYSSAGECFIMDAGGTATQQTPHDKDGLWIFNSIDTKTGHRLIIHMERFMRKLEEHFGWGFIEEMIEDAA